MFETVAPETFEKRSKRVFYETLPLSIALHVIVIIAAIVAAVWNVVLPVESPRLSRAYSLVTIPDPPPPPPPPPKAVAQTFAPPKVPDQIVAPTVIPDTIPTIPDPPPPAIQTLAPAPTPASVGVPQGDPQGDADGQIGGDLLKGMKGGIVFPDDGRVHIGLNENLPLLPISQDYPLYPDEAKKKQLEDQVIVRYTIGKNGRVIDVQILDHAVNPIFDKATVDAIKLWRFRPLIKDGKPVEVVHDLAVNFQLVRH